MTYYKSCCNLQWPLQNPVADLTRHLLQLLPHSMEFGISGDLQSIIPLQAVCGPSTQLLLIECYGSFTTCYCSNHAIHFMCTPNILISICSEQGYFQFGLRDRHAATPIAVSHAQQSSLIGVNYALLNSTTGQDINQANNFKMESANCMTFHRDLHIFICL